MKCGGSKPTPYGGTGERGGDEVAPYGGTWERGGDEVAPYGGTGERAAGDACLVTVKGGNENGSGTGDDAI